MRHELCLVILLSSWVAPAIHADEPKAPSEARPLASALASAGENRAELERALADVDTDARPGLVFLIEHMPEHDLKSLSAEFLLEHVRYAYRARKEFPWARQLPQDLFFNDVLAYASANERRDAWRQRFYERFKPLVEDCKTGAEAAHRLNQKIFGLLSVKYSTGRRKADQSPLETIESGLASCTGLSILLVDACRAVGVPARIAGIPSWTNKRGNHTWVEVWDKKWHFAGAAEPSSKGLNHVWFRHDASLAKKDSRRHAIYASSYRRTGLLFPLVWAPKADYVHAVNVTDRYAKEPAPSTSNVRLLVRVLRGEERVAAAVSVHDTSDEESVQRGTSKDEGADTNDILVFKVHPGRTFRIRAEQDGLHVEVEHTCAESEQTVTLRLPKPKA